MDVLATSPFAPGSNPSDPTVTVFLVTKIQRPRFVCVCSPCLLARLPACRPRGTGGERVGRYVGVTGRLRVIE